MTAAALARLRVPLGFAAAAVALLLARPTPRSIAVGLALASVGEGLRLWASGHIVKGDEITTSGPYRYVRHPLYVGSSIMAVGFAVAAASAPVAALVALYMGVTVLAAIRTEEATLDDRFRGQYSAYREGRAAASTRRFSWARVGANREYRTVAGFAIGAFLLVIRSWW